MNYGLRQRMVPLLILAGIFRCPAEEPPLSPALISGLERASAGFPALVGKSVRIIGRCEEFSARDGVAPSSPTSWYTFETTFNYGDPSWMKIICPEYKGATDQPGRFAEREVTFVFQAGKWYSMESAAISGGKKLPTKTCTIEKTSPGAIGAGDLEFGSGMAAFAPMLKIYRRRTLQELLEDGADKAANPYTLEVKAEGDKVEMVWADACQKFTLWLGKSDSFGLLPAKLVQLHNLCPPAEPFSIELEFANEGVLEGLPVKIPYARTLTRRIFADGKLSYTSTISIERIEIGAAASLEEMTFEPGWMIMDEVLGVSYLTGESKKHMMQTLRSISER